MDTYDRAFSLFAKNDLAGGYEALTKGDLGQDYDAHELAAWMYKNGKGTPVNLSLSEFHFRAALDSGNLSAVHGLASVLLLQNNREEALKLFNSACEKGYLPSMFALGSELVLSGLETERKFGLGLLRRASDSGHFFATRRLITAEPKTWANGRNFLRLIFRTMVNLLRLPLLAYSNPNDERLLC
jgi:TPR repeat protein